MEDITPELLSKIEKAFKAAIEKNKKDNGFVRKDPRRNCYIPGSK